VLEGALGSNKLNVCTILYDLLLLLELNIVLLCDVGEAPLLGDDDLLPAGELVAGTTEGLHDDVCVGVLGADGEDDLANVDAGDGAVGFTPCTAHAGLKAISAGTGQHLVDADDVEGVYAYAEVEGVFSGGLCDVFVSADSCSFECFAGELLVFIGDEVAAEGEFVDVCTFTTEVEYADLWVRYTTVVTRLWVRFVFAVTITSSRTTTHYDESDRERWMC